MSLDKSTVAPSTSAFASKLATISTALGKIPAELPAVVGGFYRFHTGVFALNLEFGPYGWKAVDRLIPWAEAFDASLYVSLTSYGSSGQVETSFEVDGVVFALDERIGTAEAYQLGSVVGRPLNADKGVSLTPAEMRSALTLIAGA